MSYILCIALTLFCTDLQFARLMSQIQKTGGGAVATWVASDDPHLLQHFLLSKRSLNTQRAYARILRDFFGSYFDGEDDLLSTISAEMVQHITPTHVNAYLTAVEERSSQSTARTYRASLSSFFNWMVGQGHLPRSPFVGSGVRTYKKEKLAITTFSEDEVQAMLAYAQNQDKQFASRDHALLMVLIYGWLRRQEAADLKFKDIKKTGDYWVLRLRQTKKGTSDEVKVPAHVVDELGRLRDHYVSLGGDKSGHVFRSFARNHFLEPLSARSVYGIVKRIGKAVCPGRSFEAIGAHTMRHTAATLAIKKGATIIQVQQQARHASQDTTMQYVHHNDWLANNATDGFEF